MRAWLAVVLAGCGLATNPGEVTFGGRTLAIVYDDQPCAYERGELARCLGAGTVIAYDFTGDGVDDLASYRDTRDGFRDTFAYLDIWCNDGTPLAVAPVTHAKWKDGHWDWIDERAFPGLAGPRFVRFMEAQDREHD